MSDTAKSRDELRSMTTQTLVDHAAQGDQEAVLAIFERLRPRVLRWSHGRLPTYARDLSETDDIVQDAMLRSLGNLEGFQQHGGGLLSYICTAVINRVRNEIRRVKRRPEQTEIDESLPGHEASPIELVVGRESEERYRQALAKLSSEHQDLIVGRLELEMSYQELALHTGKPSADAARMSLRRAIRKLAETLAEDEPRARTDR